MGKRRTVEEVNGGDNSIDSKNINLDTMAIHIHGGVEHNLAKYAKYYFWDAQKVVNSQGKLIIVEDIFLDIGKQML